MHRRIAWSMWLASACLIGCVKAHPNGPGAPNDALDESQIAALHASTAYDVVSRTHAQYLHSRGRESMDPKTPAIPAHVYVDDTYYGDLSTLRVFPASQLAGIRFYEGFEAQYKFGSGHMGGVIQLITKQ